MSELLDLKKIEQALTEKHDELLVTIDKANEEAKIAGSVAVETKAEINAVSETLNGLSDRLQEMEQKGAHGNDENVEISIGEQFTKSAAFESMTNVDNPAGTARMNLKTAIINATGQNQPLVPADRLGGINATPNQMLMVRDMLPVTGTNSNLIEFVRENVFTNSADVVVAGSPQAFENVAKAESGLTFTLETEAVQTIAHFIPASKQVIADSAQLQGYINGRLTYGLKLKEEAQLLTGTGANGQLNGLITQATAYTPESPQLTNKIDIIRDAITQAQVSNYMPDGVVMNPTDWDAIERLHVGASDDRYVIGDPRSNLATRLWGLPVSVSNSISAGTFLLGSFGMGAEIKDRMQATVEVSREHSDNFTKNMITILAEERIALVVYRTEAFITGSF